MSTPRTWDIFCTVIDNFGDIGVTWRLARQLVAEYGLEVRLWVDDLPIFQRLCPSAKDCDEQRIEGVIVRRWPSGFPQVEPAQVVIEAFACALPKSYVSAIAAQTPRPVWINLDYLSAESWVNDCHGLPSPQPEGLHKYFFFPGFSDGTGGLLHERDLEARRRAFQDDPASARSFLEKINRGLSVPDGGRLVSLFAYENPAIPKLLDLWAAAPRPTLCLVPEGRALAKVGAVFGRDLKINGIYRRGSLSVAVLPFLAQDEYDRLLWSCDLNFVRGEDSFLRAQWAGRPLLWQIYPQNDAAHLAKLNAFIALYTKGLNANAADALRETWLAWNGVGSIETSWPKWEITMPLLQKHAQQWAGHYAQRENLAQKLVQFCANQV